MGTVVGTRWQKARAPVAPCAKCGTPGGSTYPYDDRPIRLKGDRFGYPGRELCKTCYAGLMRRLCGQRKPRMFRPEIRLGPDEIEPRVAIVRAAKLAKAAMDLEPILTDAELDEILPAIPCARTRLRMAKGDAWRAASERPVLVGIRDQGAAS